MIRCGRKDSPCGLLCANAEFRDVGGQRGKLSFEPFGIGIYRVDKLIQDLPGRRKLKFAVVVFVEFGLGNKPPDILNGGKRRAE